MKTIYSPVVAQLLTLGDPYKNSYDNEDISVGENLGGDMEDGDKILPLIQFVLPDYRALGLSEENIPELLKLAMDMDIYMENDEEPIDFAEVLGEEPFIDESEYDEDEENIRFFGVIHAWHALAQLKAESAVPSLFALMLVMIEVDDDWGISELPAVLGAMGQISLELILIKLNDGTLNEEAQITCLEVIQAVNKAHPELRNLCINILVSELEQERVSRSYNGFIVDTLIHLKAVEVLETIRYAYLWDLVNLEMCGDIEEVEIALGVRSERSTPARHWLHEEARRLQPIHDLFESVKAQEKIQKVAKIGRNDPCTCGSGKKYKKCCGK